MKTSAIRAKDPNITSAVIATPASSAQSQVGPACSNVIPEPTATRSAAMFSAFAASRPTSSAPTRMRAGRLRHRTVTSSPRLLPVASAVRSQISCTAVISGKVIRLTHSMP